MISPQQAFDLFCLCIIVTVVIAFLTFIMACVIYAIKQKNSIDLEEEYLEEEYREKE